jgi:ATP-binding cassette, subfamily B, bacterial
MKDLRLLWKLMKGNRIKYAAAILSIAVSTYISIQIPLIIRFSVDHVIGKKPAELSAFIRVVLGIFERNNIDAVSLWICGAAIVSLRALDGLFQFLKGKCSSEASEAIARNTRNRLYDHLQRMSYDYHVKSETGDLLQRCSSDVETIRRFLAMQFVEMGRGVFMLITVSAIMFTLNVKLALISMIALPILFTAAFVFFTKVQKVFLMCDESEGRLSTTIQENLTGMRVVRAFGKERYEIDRFDEKNSEYRDLVYKLIRLLAFYWSISDGVCLIQIASILVIGAYMSSLGLISIGTLLVFMTYEGMLLWPVRQMGRILTDMGKSFVAAKRIFEILDAPTEKMEETGLKQEIKGSIEFNNVSFQYDEGKPVLNNISFDIKAGQTVAILGPTGSGKTSLVNLIPRLYDYTSGSIKVDGVELNAIDKKWIRKNVGIALQEPFLFSKTIKENIMLSKEKAKEEEVYSAAGIASVHDTILEFEQGYETAVGEKGVTLSGGQKQRVAIARTILNNYPILIFDDSLSAVDTETDAAIRKALKERSKEVTTFIISHRITTLAEADIILVLDKGHLIQKGTHEELIAQEGLYKKIWKIQNSLEKDLEEEFLEGDSEMESA